MKRFAPAVVALALIAAAPPPLETELARHITVLASDDYGGRLPGTDGEAKTLRYLAREWYAAGLVSGTNDPGNPWFAPVTLIAREPAGGSAQFSRKGRAIYVPGSDVLVLTSGERAVAQAAPVLFVGRGEIVPPRGELAGRVALLLDNGRSDSVRQNALLAGGAAAVVTVLDGARSLAQVRAQRQRSGFALAGGDLGGDLEAFIAPAALDRALAGARTSTGQLAAQAATANFAPLALDLSLGLEASSRETRINTHNLIGRIPGRHPEAGAVMVLAHWDGFGRCAVGPDPICNGAVDNASGLAVLTAIARRLAAGPKLERDVYLVATTAEEMGLLGAQALLENPPLPLERIVAALNIDSVAVAPTGSPITIVGKGLTPLDPVIAQVAREQKRKLVDSPLAETFLKRQDGWALLQRDVPAVMVSSAYADPAAMQAFLDSRYHRPGDEANALVLGGAAGDVTLHVALVRRLADPRRVPLPAAKR
jgi:hypothetical protein